MQKFLMKREQPTESLPQPTDSPAKLARQTMADAQATAQSMQSPTAPDVPAQSEVEAVSVPRQIASQQRSRQSATDLAAAAPAELRLRAPAERSLAAERNRSTQMPMIGESGMRRERREQSTSSRMQPLGAAPAPQAVAVAHEVQAAERKSVV